MLIDTHCHLCSDDYENVEEVIKNMDGIMIASGCSDKTNKEVLELIEKYPNVYGAIGIHPEEVNTITNESFKFIEENIDNPKVVAIGEIGLDYYWVKDNKEIQKEVFKKQLDIASKYNKPVIIHSRDAIQDTYNLVKKYGVTGVMHCYAGSYEMALEFIKLGFLIGVGGVVTFKNAKNIKDIVLKIPLSSISLETDSPYLSPEPFRGKTNIPSNVDIIAEEIANLKGIAKENVILQTGQNISTKFDL